MKSKDCYYTAFKNDVKHGAPARGSSALMRTAQNFFSQVDVPANYARNFATLQFPGR